MEFRMIAKARELPRTDAIGKGLRSTQTPQRSTCVFTRQRVSCVGQNHVMTLTHILVIANTFSLALASDGGKGRNSIPIPDGG